MFVTVPLLNEFLAVRASLLVLTAVQVGLPGLARFELFAVRTQKRERIHVYSTYVTAKTKWSGGVTNSLRTRSASRGFAIVFQSLSVVMPRRRHIRDTKHAHQLLLKGKISRAEYTGPAIIY